MLLGMQVKRCPFCRRDLEPAAFASDSRFADGCSPRCQDCAAGLRQAAPEAQGDTPASPVGENPWIVAKRLRWALRRVRLPNRRRARKLVESALRSGDLVRQPCELGLPGCEHEPVEAHHRSYDVGKELEIVWVCKPCHDQLTAPVLAESNANRR